MGRVSEGRGREAEKQEKSERRERRVRWERGAEERQAGEEAGEEGERGPLPPACFRRRARALQRPEPSRHLPQPLPARPPPPHTPPPRPPSLPPRTAPPPSTPVGGERCRAVSAARREPDRPRSLLPAPRPQHAAGFRPRREACEGAAPTPEALGQPRPPRRASARWGWQRRVRPGRGRCSPRPRARLRTQRGSTRREALRSKGSGKRLWLPTSPVR